MVLPKIMFYLVTANILNIPVVSPNRSYSIHSRMAITSHQVEPPLQHGLWGLCCASSRVTGCPGADGLRKSDGRSWQHDALLFEGWGLL